jgi:hypothetical protein
MERVATVWEERPVGDLVEVGRTGKDALSIFLPVFLVAGVVDFVFHGGKSLQNELKGISERESVLTGDASGDLVNEEFAESNVDGGGRLKIADGGENVGSDDISSGDAAHFAIEMMMAERSVSGIIGVGAALTVSAKMLTACGTI